MGRVQPEGFGRGPAQPLEDQTLIWERTPPSALCEPISLVPRQAQSLKLSCGSHNNRVSGYAMGSNGCQEESLIGKIC